MGKKQSYKNIAMNVFAFVVQFFISFYISPLIVSKVGASAFLMILCHMLQSLQRCSTR